MDNQNSNSGQTLPLTKNQIIILNALDSLLNFGGERIISKPPPLKLRPRKAILLSMMAAVHNYSEGIFSLLKEQRTNSAEILIRPLIETLINLSYTTIGRNEQNAVQFLLDDEYKRKELAVKIKKFLIEYPKYKTSLDKMKTSTDWNKFIIEREKDIAEMKKHYRYFNMKQLPNLRKRAQKYDNSRASKFKRELKTRLEWWYLTMYWYFSNLAHLNTRGLGSFITTDTNGNETINLSGDPTSITRIGITTYAIYFTFLRTYGLQFRILKSDELKIYKETLKMLINLK